MSRRFIAIGSASKGADQRNRAVLAEGGSTPSAHSGMHEAGSSILHAARRPTLPRPSAIPILTEGARPEGKESQRMTQQSDSAAESHRQHERLQKAKHVAMEEIRGYLIAFAYIWLLLGIFVLHEEIALRTHGDRTFAPHGLALLNALVLAKVALLVEDLRLGQRIKPQPLIYPILIEALLLAVLFIAIHVLESVIVGLLHGRGVEASLPDIAGGGPLGVLFAAVSFFVAMVPFCAFLQIRRAIGPEKMRALLFGTPAEGSGGGG